MDDSSGDDCGNKENEQHQQQQKRIIISDNMTTESRNLLTTMTTTTTQQEVRQPEELSLSSSSPAVVTVHVNDVGGGGDDDNDSSSSEVRNEVVVAAIDNTQVIPPPEESQLSSSSVSPPHASNIINRSQLRYIYCLQCVQILILGELLLGVGPGITTLFQILFQDDDCCDEPIQLGIITTISCILFLCLVTIETITWFYGVMSLICCYWDYDRVDEDDEDDEQTTSCCSEDDDDDDDDDDGNSNNNNGDEDEPPPLPPQVEEEGEEELNVVVVQIDANDDHPQNHQNQPQQQSSSTGGTYCCCCRHRDNASRIIPYAINWMTFFNFYFIAISTWNSLYQKSQIECYIFLTLICIAHLIHLILVIRLHTDTTIDDETTSDGEIQRRRRKCWWLTRIFVLTAHCILSLIPFLVTSLSILIYLHHGGICYNSTDPSYDHFFGYDGCHLCLKIGLPQPQSLSNVDNNNECHATIQDTYCGEAEEGEEGNDHIKFCFFTYYWNYCD